MLVNAFGEPGLGIRQSAPDDPKRQTEVALDLPERTPGNVRESQHIGSFRIDGMKLLDQRIQAVERESRAIDVHQVINGRM